MAHIAADFSAIEAAYCGAKHAALRPTIRAANGIALHAAFVATLLSAIGSTQY